MAVFKTSDWTSLFECDVKFGKYDECVGGRHLHLWLLRWLRGLRGLRHIQTQPRQPQCKSTRAKMMLPLQMALVVGSLRRLCVSNSTPTKPAGFTSAITPMGDPLRQMACCGSVAKEAEASQAKKGCTVSGSSKAFSIGQGPRLELAQSAPRTNCLRGRQLWGGVF